MSELMKLRNQVKMILKDVITNKRKLNNSTQKILFLFIDYITEQELQKGAYKNEN